MSLLEMSISAAIMIIVILLIRTIGKKYISKSIVMGLWNLVLIRALLPFQIPVGDILLFGRGYDRIQAYKISVGMPLESVKSGNFSAATQENMQGIVNMDAVYKTREYLMLIWMIGMVCLSVYFIRIYIKEHRELKKCIPVQNETAGRLIRSLPLHRKIQLYEGGSFHSPITYGVLRPKIVLPENMAAVSRVDMRNMIAHELVHIQRYDVTKRFFMIVVLGIHWFNPLIWVMYHCYRADQEMACDEGVLRNMAGSEVKNYVYTMIKMASGGRMLWSTTGFVGKDAERKRILAAMNQKRMGKGSILAAVILCLCLALPFLSFTKTKEETDIERPEVRTEIEEPHMESLEAVKKEQALLSPLYEGEVQSPVTENFDYEAVMQDIIENYNDVGQPLTEEQDKALIVQDFIHMASVFKRRQDRGEKLNPRELWVLDEFYEYGE